MGFTVEKDFSRAKELLQELVAQGGPTNAIGVARILECEADLPGRDYDEIIYWKKIAGTDVKTGDAVPYADEIKRGLFTQQDLGRAEEIYQYYADYGHIPAIQSLLGLLLGGELNAHSAVRIYQWASNLRALSVRRFDAELASLDAELNTEQREVLKRLLDERDIKFDTSYKESFNLTQIPFEDWRPTALGTADETFRYLRSEASQGNAPAQLYLAQLYLACPIRGQVDYTNSELFELLTESANAGYPPAKFLLGLSIHGGNYSSEGEAAALILEAAQEGDFSAQNLLALSYTNSPGLLISPVLPPDPVQGYFWSYVFQQNYLNTLDLALNTSGNLIGHEIKEEIKENAKGWEPKTWHGYPVLFDSWPGPLTIIGSVISLIASLILSYLSLLTLRAAPNNIKNLTVASILFLDAWLLILIFVPVGLPANLFLREIFNGAAIAIGSIGMLACTSYYILAGQFVTPLSKPLSGDRARVAVIIAGILCAVILPLWIERIFHFGFTEMQEGLQLGYRSNSTLYLVGFTFLAHIFTLINLIYFSRLNHRESQEGRQASAFLLAYIIRFGFLGVAIATFFTVELIDTSLSYGNINLSHPNYYLAIIILYATGELLYGLLFALGILREQIFGIERLFKRNLVRIVLLGFFTLGFLSAEQLIESLISEDYGTLGGIMVACSMLTVNRPLSKIIREQVDLFLPDKNIIEDDAAKVYAHHYRLAMRDGELSKKERDMLRLTAKSLGLTKSQISAIESRVVDS